MRRRIALRPAGQLLALCCCLIWLTSCTLSAPTPAKPAGEDGGTDTSKADPKAPPTYIVLMVPDGMGLSDVTAARIYKNGPNGDPLHLETLPYIGYQRTHSKNSTVTDSAAASSAWASGEKFNNGEISCHDDNGDGKCDQNRKNKRTILEPAQDKGMSVGLVATSDITHATPAALAAHVHSRRCESEIFKQYLDGGVDVLLGGGMATNRGPCRLEPTENNQDLIERAEDEGYAYVTTKTEMLRQAPKAERILGDFSDGGLTPLYVRSASSTEPTLEQMTGAALDVLEDRPEGFFLMVEGSQIDWANHDNDFERERVLPLAQDSATRRMDAEVMFASIS